MVWLQNREKNYILMINYETLQLERSLNPLSNTTDRIPNRLTKLKLHVKHDDQRIAEIGYASGIKTSELLLL